MVAFSRTRRRTAVALGAAAVLAAGLISVQTPGASARPLSPSTRATAGQLPYQDASLPIPQRVADLLGRMTLDEKIGQMTQAERASVDSDADLHKITTTTSAACSPAAAPCRRRTRPPPGPTWSTATRLQALTTPLHIPILYGIDTVHGDGNMDGATVFPHNIGLGATRDPALVRRVEHVAASETRSTGPQWAFAPCICVARDDRWGRIYESFGESPGPRGVDGDRDRRLPGSARTPLGQRPGCWPPPSTSPATG